MAEQQQPPWLGLKQDILNSMQDLTNSLTASMTLMSDEMSTKLNDLVESYKFLEVSFNEARVEASEATKQVKALTAPLLS